MEKMTCLVHYGFATFPFWGVPSTKGPKGLKNDSNPLHLVMTFASHDTNHSWPHKPREGLTGACCPPAPGATNLACCEGGFQVWQAVFAEFTKKFSGFPVIAKCFLKKIPSGKLRWQWKFPQFPIGKEFFVHLAMSQFLVVYVWFLAG